MGELLQSKPDGFASSPKGGASGVSAKPTLDEQSLLYPETVVPCYQG